MAAEFLNIVWNGPGDYAVAVKNLTASCHRPQAQCVFEMRRTKEVPIEPLRMNEITYILCVLTGICKDLLNQYHITVVLETVEAAHILRIRFRVNKNAFRIRNEELRRNLIRATELGISALGYRTAVLDREQERILNIAVPR